MAAVYTLLLVLYFLLGDGTFARITNFFAQLWIHSTATYCPTPIFTTTTTAHATTSTGSESKQTCTSNPAFQRVDPSRNSAQHDCCNWKGNNIGIYSTKINTKHSCILFYGIGMATHADLASKYLPSL